VYYSVYDRLTQYDINHVVQPMLAESWDVATDFMSIKFNLRKGMQWHTGRDFTSDDVKWNLLRVRDGMEQQDFVDAAYADAGEDADLYDRVAPFAQSWFGLRRYWDKRLEEQAAT